MALLGVALAGCGGNGSAASPGATALSPPASSGSQANPSPSASGGGPTLLITSSDGFKVIVSMVSADESATADPANPAPPGLTNLVLRLNEHNVQTDRPAPFVDLVRNLVLVIDSKNLPGITTTKGPMAAFRPYPDCEAWGAKNAPGASNSSGVWVPVMDTSSGQTSMTRSCVS
ncbi:hypothetical protein [Kribbella sp. NBC_00359]|uniref:hypothetical protein n=1 Tax=Kribbella sp. NBC_00359 TaxID=2975966 RepID=UPI002E206C9D